MSYPWTYSGDPSASSRDQVRFLTGQTSTGDAVLVYDREIAWALGQYGSVYYTAAAVCDIMAGQYASGQAIRTKVGDLDIQYGANRAEGLRVKANDLRRQGGRGVTVYDGSADDAGRQTDEADTGLVQPMFGIGMDNLVGST